MNGATIFVSAYFFHTIQAAWQGLMVWADSKCFFVEYQLSWLDITSCHHVSNVEIFDISKTILIFKINSYRWLLL